MVCQVCNMTADRAVHSGCGNGGQSRHVKFSEKKCGTARVD